MLVSQKPSRIAAAFQPCSGAARTACSCSSLSPATARTTRSALIVGRSESAQALAGRVLPRHQLRRRGELLRLVRRYGHSRPRLARRPTSLAGGATRALVTLSGVSLVNISASVERQFASRVAPLAVAIPAALLLGYFAASPSPNKFLGLAIYGSLCVGLASRCAGTCLSAGDPCTGRGIDRVHLAGGVRGAGSALR